MTRNAKTPVSHLSSISAEIEKGYTFIYDTLKRGSTIFICGNGGSAADAMHLAAELTGRYKKNRRPLPAIALGTNPSEVTCIANDFGYEHIFARPLSALGKPGDCLIGISTSGASPNVVRAWECGRNIGMTAIGLTGDKHILSKLDLHIACPSQTTARIQEMHQRIYHYWCERLDEEEW